MKKAKSGNRPYYNSEDVEVKEINHGRRSVSFRCRKCGKGDHFDGILNEKKGDHQSEMAGGFIMLKSCDIATRKEIECLHIMVIP